MPIQALSKKLTKLNLSPLLQGKQLTIFVANAKI